MRISLLAVGTRMPAWVEQGVADYRRRLPPEIRLDIRELPLAKRVKTTDLRRAVGQEGESLLGAVPAGDRIVALDVGGRALSTPELARELDGWLMAGDNISLLVGGPDGLSEDCLQRAQWRWSLSALTLPHPLVRIVVCEQLYRAWSILNNHPYHR
jgi:23S rRNA (pseudouridine1915-N3)-methyltransferase